jgi:hypothetical protein
MKNQSHRGALLDGRSIEDCLEEYSPRAQALKDARAREVLRALDLERDIAKLRSTTDDTDPRKVAIRAVKRRYPKVKGVAFAIALDNAEIEPLPSWTAAAGGKRLWFELWQHRATKGAVRKYLSETIAKITPL